MVDKSGKADSISTLEKYFCVCGQTHYSKALAEQHYDKWIKRTQ